MTKPNNKHPNRIRKITSDSNDKGRQWPGKKSLASEQDMPVLQPGQKSRIHSVLVALPIIMLCAGLFVYFRGESAQNGGTPIVNELVRFNGQFKSVSQVSGIGTPKHFLWITVGDSSRGVRLKASQVNQLAGLKKGDAVELEVAPTVPESKTLWAYRVRHNNADVIAPVN